jgi:hypothetical protein
MVWIFIFFIFLFQIQFVFCQQTKMKPLEALISHEEPGSTVVQEWMKDAKNDIEVLEKDSIQADSALYRTQVTTRSPMGAIIYETGGILVDHGWIRILGSGSATMKRNVPEWNKGKSFDEYGNPWGFVLIADDVIGGFFALNGGAFGQENLGKVFYFAPDNLNWEPLDIGYSDFIYWTFTGDLDEYYEGLRWKNWREEVKTMGPNRAMHFLPYLCTKFENIEDLSRSDIPVEEIWSDLMNLRKMLLKDKD